MGSMAVNGDGDPAVDGVVDGQWGRQRSMESIAQKLRKKFRQIFFYRWKSNFFRVEIFFLDLDQ